MGPLLTQTFAGGENRSKAGTCRRREHGPPWARDTIAPAFVARRDCLASRPTGAGRPRRPKVAPRRSVALESSPPPVVGIGRALRAEMTSAAEVVPGEHPASSLTRDGGRAFESCPRTPLPRAERGRRANPLAASAGLVKPISSLEELRARAPDLVISQ
jgi:hypothetical protein